MQFSVRPCGELKSQVLPQTPSADYLNLALTNTMTMNEPIEFDFRVQVKKPENLEKLGIENATVAWDWSDTNPDVTTVAKVTVPAPQLGINCSSEREDCEKRFFTPWHAHKDHQPLGGINRLRRAVYFASAAHRGANGYLDGRPRN